MKRIGLAASKISKGNIALYNSYVVLISFLFSLFMFIVVGVTVVFALIVLSYVSNEIVPFEFEKRWPNILSLCMVSLTVVTAIFNVCAILQNIKIPSKKDIEG